MSKHLKYFEIPEQDFKAFFEEEAVFEASEMDIVDEDAAKLANAMKLIKPDQLKSLYLHRNKIGDEGFAAIVKAIPSVPSLEVLMVSQNKLTDDSMKAFAALAGTQGGAGIKQISLQRNKIGDNGMRHFAKAIAAGALPNLEWFFMSENDIGDEGVIAFAEAIQGGACPKLARVALQGNHFGDPAMKALARALAGGAMDEQGEYLYVQENKFTEDGRTAVVEALRTKKADSILQAHYGWPPPLSLADMRRDKGLKGPFKETGGDAKLL